MRVYKRAHHSPTRNLTMRLHGLTIAAIAGTTMAMAVGITARAEESCAPKSNAAKILRSANIRDIHPNWRPPNSIGTSWSLVSIRRQGPFMQGALVNPRGGELPGRVWVVVSEWDCE
jgi:hypothetical protein